MPPKRRQSTEVSPDQGEFFVIAHQSGQLAISEPAEGLAVSIIERDIHLQNVLTYLLAVNSANGFIEHDSNAFYRGQPTAPPAITRGTEKNRATYSQNAKAEFMQATGNSLLLKEGLLDPPAYRRLGRVMFSDFLKKYYGSKRHSQAVGYRKQLIANTTAHQEDTVVLDRQYDQEQSKQERPI